LDAEDIKSGGARYPGERQSGTRLARGPRRASERQVGDGFEGCLSFLLFAELRETIDELSEFEFEDESAEGTAAAIIPGIIDALEQEKLDL
jgi:hypothetical protein